MESAMKDNSKVVVPAGTELINIIGDKAGILPIVDRKGKGNQ
jgi:hypothetical protein